MQSPLFDIFDRRKYQKFSDKEKSEIFYHSLFEYTHFDSPYMKKSSKDIRRFMIRALRKNGTDSIKKQMKKDENSVIYKNFFTAKICELMITEELSARMGVKWTWRKRMNNTEIDIFLEREKLCLEVKRVICGGNLRQYIQEVKEKATKFGNDYIFLLVFIFICNDEDEVEYLKYMEITFRSIFQLLREGEVIPENLEFFICGFSPKSSFSEFIGKLINRCEKIISMGGESDSFTPDKTKQ